MKTNRSMAWLREAAGGIKYPPDRKKVEEELYAHMVDRNRDFLRMGYTEREADERVCTVMGDPSAVRRELAAIHRPFWGYAFLVLRILAAGVLLWALISCLWHFRDIRLQLRPLSEGDRYTVARWVEQSSSARCGDYTLRLYRAGYAREQETGESCLLLEIEAVTPDPFLGSPLYTYLCADLQVQDSRGEVYPVTFVDRRELVFTSRALLAVEGMPAGADWAVLELRGAEGPARLAIRLGEGRT